MGAWGTGPFDNDAAGDMIAELFEPIRNMLECLVKGGYTKRGRLVCVGRGRAMIRQTTFVRSYAMSFYCDARAAALLVLDASGNDILGGPPLEMALEALRWIRLDQNWLDSWRDPAEIAAALDRDIERLEARVTVIRSRPTVFERLAVRRSRRRRR